MKKIEITKNSKTGALIQKNYLYDVPNMLGEHDAYRSIHYDNFLSKEDTKSEHWVSYCPIFF